jgi:restriction system protein
VGAIVLSAGHVHKLIAKALRDSIDDYRATRASLDPTYQPPSGDVTREEIDRFIAANPEIDFANANMLFPPGSLGSDDSFALRVRSEVYEEFEEELDETVRGLAEGQTWLEKDDPEEAFALIPELVRPVQRRLWLPERQQFRPQWIDSSRSALLLARELIEEGRLLSEMEWRDFEKLIAELLERDGWEIQLMRGTKDGGIDVISSRNDAAVGRLKAIWQAKRYGEGHKVQLAHARELSGVVERERASKGVLVTTTSLTKGAVKWIKQDEFRLDAKDGEAVKRWIEKYS